MPIGEIPSTIPESDIMKEVEDCEKQCMEIYAILNELKKRVAELLSVSLNYIDELTFVIKKFVCYRNRQEPNRRIKNYKINRGN